MSSSFEKHDRAAEVVRELAAQFLALHSNRTSLITVTNVDLSPDERNARVLLSVLPEHSTRGALDFANRQARDFYAFMKGKTRLRTIPRVVFAVDDGEKNRQRIDALLIADTQEHPKMEEETEDLNG